MHKDIIFALLSKPADGGSEVSTKEVTPCSVVLDESIGRGTIELSRKFFKRTGLREGDPAVVTRGWLSVSVKTRLGKNLGPCEMAAHPFLVAFFDVEDDERADREGPVRVLTGKEAMAPPFPLVLEESLDGWRKAMGRDLGNFSGVTVGEALDHIVRYQGSHAGQYLVVAPNADDVGIPRGDICEDPSLSVKEWDPEAGRSGRRM